MTNKKYTDSDYEKDKDGKIIFKFGYVRDNKPYGEYSVEKSVECPRVKNLKTDEYEENLYIKYWYNLLKVMYDNLSSEKFCIVYNYTIEGFFSDISTNNSLFHKYKIFKKFSLGKLCKSITGIDFIQKQFNLNIKNDGYCYISRDKFINNTQSNKFLLGSLELILEDLKNYLSKLDFNKLKTTYYTDNFKTYTTLINLGTNKKLYDFFEYLFYMKLNLFNRHLSGSFYSFVDNFPSNVEANKYIGFLFTNCKGSSLKPNLDELELNDTLEYLCFSQFESKDKFVNSILNKINKSDLTYKAFDYVPEYKYIKTIIKNAVKEKTKGINILLYGEPGTGKTAMAKTLITELGLNGYEVTIQNDNYYDSMSLDANNKNISFMTTKYILKNSSNSIILYDEAEDFFRKKYITDITKDSTNKILEDNEIPIIWTTNDIDILEESFKRRFTYICNVSFMSKDIYMKIFKKLCKSYDLPFNNDLFNLCFVEKVSIGIIKKAFKNSQLTKMKDIEYLITDIKNTLKAQNSHFVLKSYIQRPKKFDPKLLNTSDDLDCFCKKMKENKRLDFSLLLYGVSGSGKSYYAEYLAEQLGLPILKKKASDLESCWVGETEHNIANAFEEARKTKSVLIIDEGDHFISERSQHNRSWETSRTEEMLQQIEMHPYPIIFTTNLMQNIDKAAMRRFTYKTKFDYLTKDQVKIAWRDYFPKAILPKEIYLSRLCPGDFATVYKKAEFEGYLSDTSTIYKKLEEEMINKKETEDCSIRF